MPAAGDAAPELDALLVRLRRMSPMPPDEQINPTFLRAYREIFTSIADRGVDPRAIGPLLASLGPGEARGTFDKVIEWIACFDAAVAGPPLLHALERGTLGGRRWAAVALGRIGWLGALAALRLAREDQDPIVRQNADLAVRRLEAQIPEEEVEEDEGYDPLFDGIAEEK